MVRVGAGFRFEIADSIERHLSEFDALEIMVEHFFSVNDHYRQKIRDFVGRVPLVGHGLGLSLGTFVKPDGRYLERVARTLDDLGALYYSEHLAFTRVPGIELAELVPLPRTLEVAEHVISNIQYVKSFLDIPFYLENVAYYFEYPDSNLSDGEFFSYICREAGCSALLDVQNIYANSLNHGADAKAFIDALPNNGIGALHLAGGYWSNGIFVDDHGHAIADEVLELTGYALRKHNPSVIIVERDQNLFEGDELISEMRRVRALAAQLEEVA